MFHRFGPDVAQNLHFYCVLRPQGGCPGDPKLEREAKMTQNKEKLSFTSFGKDFQPKKVISTCKIEGFDFCKKHQTL